MMKYLQEELRDVDLVALEMPVLFVKGTKDTFSTEEPWQEVLSRMQSPQVEVVTVEKGDHSLSTKSGIGKQRSAKADRPVESYCITLNFSPANFLSRYYHRA